MDDDSYTDSRSASQKCERTHPWLAVVTVLAVVIILVPVSAWLLEVSACIAFLTTHSLDRQSAARAEIRYLTAGLERYTNDLGRFPSESEGLSALLVAPASGDETVRWNGPYAPHVAHDPWGLPYEYTNDGSLVRVSSHGPDGKSGTADDLLGANIASQDSEVSPSSQSRTQEKRRDWPQASNGLRSADRR
jgi:general secretion pathway protein G